MSKLVPHLRMSGHWEAADEIERLRDALKQIADIAFVDDLCTIPVRVDHLQNAAREALAVPEPQP